MRTRCEQGSAWVVGAASSGLGALLPDRSLAGGESIAVAVAALRVGGRKPTGRCAPLSAAAARSSSQNGGDKQAGSRREEGSSAPREPTPGAGVPCPCLGNRGTRQPRRADGSRQLRFTALSAAAARPTVPGPAHRRTVPGCAGIESTVASRLVYARLRRRRSEATARESPSTRVHRCPVAPPPSVSLTGNCSRRCRLSPASRLNSCVRRGKVEEVGVDGRDGEGRPGRCEQVHAGRAIGLTEARGHRIALSVPCAAQRRERPPARGGAHAVAASGRRPPSRVATS